MYPRSVFSLVLPEELIDLFSQLPSEDQKWALARLIANALAVPPHHLYCLRVRDLLLRQPAVFAIDQRKNGIHKPRPIALVDTGASHL